jgi:hypothetical protein
MTPSPVMRTSSSMTAAVSLFTDSPSLANPPAPSRGKADFTVAAVRAKGGPGCLPPVRYASPYKPSPTLSPPTADPAGPAVHRYPRSFRLNVCIQCHPADALKQIFRNRS